MYGSYIQMHFSVNCDNNAIFCAILNFYCCNNRAILCILHRILRTKQVGKLLLHICLALAGVYASFLLAMHGEYYQQILGFCYTVSGLLQYFLLVYLFWTAIESFHICLKLVKIFGTDISNFFWKAAVIAWGKDVIVHTFCILNRVMFMSVSYL